jgi:tRNA(Ile)-lysidine synthetase-like protein
VLRPAENRAGYDPTHLLRANVADGALVVRNWRAGDRFWPAHRSRPEKVKRLLTERHVTGAERERWPVIEIGGKLLWMRGFPVAADCVAEPGEPAVLVEEIASGSATKSET